MTKQEKPNILDEIWKLRNDELLINSLLTWSVTLAGIKILVLPCLSVNSSSAGATSIK